MAFIKMTDLFFLSWFFRKPAMHYDIFSVNVQTERGTGIYCYMSRTKYLKSWNERKKILQFPSTPYSSNPSYQNSLIKHQKEKFSNRKQLAISALASFWDDVLDLLVCLYRLLTYHVDCIVPEHGRQEI